MAHHYNRYVVSDRVNCKTCEKSTDHAVINGRLAHCLDCYDRRQKQSAKKLALPQQQGFDFRGVAS